ncbi:MAG: ABC transporter ATP-binding protein [Suipraeoptans sp.]
MGFISFNHVVKTFPNGYEVVKNFNMEIELGEFVAFIGAPGSGKSTILRMVAGLEEPSLGEIRIDGELLRNIPPEDRDVSMLFQNYAIFPKMTVYENIGFGLKHRNVPDRIIEERVDKVADFLELTDILSKKPKKLSAGERQRVAFARAIITDPKILILDEPLSSQEEELREHLQRKMILAYKDLGGTILYVTHNTEEAMKLATKVVVMKSGDVHQVGTPDEIYNKPATLFVADFVGEPAINLIDGECEICGDNAFVKTHIGDIKTIPAKGSEIFNGKYSSKQIVVGIRPEAISIVDEDTDKGADEGVYGYFKGEVLATQEIRDNIWIRFKVDNKIYNALVPDETSASIGEIIEFKINTENLPLFDKETKKAISY